MMGHKNNIAAFIAAAAIAAPLHTAEAGFISYNAAEFEKNAADECVERNAQNAIETARQIAEQQHSRAAGGVRYPSIARYNDASIHHPAVYFGMPVNGQAASFAQILEQPDPEKQVFTLTTSWRVTFDTARLEDYCQYETGIYPSGTNPNKPVLHTDSLSTAISLESR